MAEEPTEGRPGEGRDTPRKAVTVAGHLAEGLHRVEVWCHDCVRCVSVPVDDLPPETPVPQIWRRYRCETCGGKNLSSRMDVIEFYDEIERERERRRRRSTISPDHPSIPF